MWCLPSPRIFTLFRPGRLGGLGHGGDPCVGREWQSYLGDGRAGAGGRVSEAPRKGHVQNWKSMEIWMLIWFDQMSEIWMRPQSHLQAPSPIYTGLHSQVSCFAIGLQSLSRWVGRDVCNHWMPIGCHHDIINVALGDSGATVLSIWGLEMDTISWPGFLGEHLPKKNNDF